MRRIYYLVCVKNNARGPTVFASNRVCSTGMGLILAVTEILFRYRVYQERWKGLPCVEVYVTLSSPALVGFGDGRAELCNSLKK